MIFSRSRALLISYRDREEIESFSFFARRMKEAASTRPIRVGHEKPSKRLGWGGLAVAGVYKAVGWVCLVSGGRLDGGRGGCDKVSRGAAAVPGEHAAGAGRTGRTGQDEQDRTGRAEQGRTNGNKMGENVDRLSHGGPVMGETPAIYLAGMLCVR